jgi:crotonobetainyl-CoA:carnitine CoA-transferase CaiB-like acyl-CoA transferase
MIKTADSSALKHLKILDLTRVRAGPTCVRFFADFGAEVLKVESPDGVEANEGVIGGRDNYDNLNLHRNKRSLTLNFKEPEGLEILYRLVKDADVVVENFRPDVKHRLKIDYETLSKINPRIIMGSISGFGQDGPYANRAGFDQIAQGMGGLMSITGIPGQGPVRAGIAVSDSTAGNYAAIGILVALLEREQSGKGQWVQSNLLQSMIGLCDFQAARYLVDHDIPPQAGNDHPFSTPMGVYQSGDGYFNLGASGNGQYYALCDVLNRPDLRDDPELQTLKGRTSRREFVNNELNKEFVKQTTSYWIEKLNEKSIPCGPIYNMAEVFQDAQVEHLGVAVKVTDPKRGPIELVATPIKLSRTPAAVSFTLHSKGADNLELLQSLGYSEDDIKKLQEKKVI